MRGNKFGLILGGLCALALTLSTLTVSTVAHATSQTPDGQPFRPHPVQTFVRDDSNSEAHAQSTNGTRLVTASMTPNAGGCTGGTAPIEFISGTVASGVTTWADPVSFGLDAQTPCVGAPAYIDKVLLSGDGTRGFLIANDTPHHSLLIKRFSWPLGQVVPTLDAEFSALAMNADGSNMWSDSASINYLGTRAVITWVECTNGCDANRRKYAVFNPGGSEIAAQLLPVQSPFVSALNTTSMSKDGSVIMIQADVRSTNAYPAGPDEFDVLTCTTDCSPSGFKKFSVSTAQVQMLTGIQPNEFDARMNESGTRVFLRGSHFDYGMFSPDNTYTQTWIAVFSPQESGTTIQLDEDMSRLQVVSTSRVQDTLAVNAAGTRIAAASKDSQGRAWVTTYDVSSRLKLSRPRAVMVNPAEPHETWLELSFIKAAAGSPERLALSVEHGATYDTNMDFPVATSWAYRVLISDASNATTWTTIFSDDTNQTENWGFDFRPSADGSRYFFYSRLRYVVNDTDTQAAHTYQSGAMLKTMILSKAPSLTGTFKYGTSISFVAGRWTSGAKVSGLSWMRDGVALAAQPRGKVYIPRNDADMAATLSVKYTLHKAGYFDYSNTVVGSKRMFGKAVIISSISVCCSTLGGITAGQSFTVSITTTPSDATIKKVEWRRGNVVVGRGTTYVAQSGDVGHGLVVRVWARRAYWTDSAPSGIGVN